MTFNKRDISPTESFQSSETATSSFLNKDFLDTTMDTAFVFKRWLMDSYFNLIDISFKDNLGLFFNYIEFSNADINAGGFSGQGFIDYTSYTWDIFDSVWSSASDREWGFSVGSLQEYGPIASNFSTDEWQSYNLSFDLVTDKIRDSVYYFTTESRHFIVSSTVSSSWTLGGING